MKKLTSLLVLLGLFAMPAFAMVASYENVPVVDVNCSKKAAAMAFHVGRMTNQRLWEQNCCGNSRQETTCGQAKEEER